MKTAGFITLLLAGSMLLCGCSKQTQAEPVQTLVAQKAFAFEDGAYAALWKSENGEDIYRLSDQTTLLVVQNPIGPAGAYAVGIESLDDLSEQAQKNVVAYYEKQGLLYHVQAELTKAYAEYLTCKENGEKFAPFFVQQEISPTCSNETIICFLTTLTLPLGNQQATQNLSGAIFHRSTGQAMPVWDAFTAAENESKQKLLDAAQLENAALKAEMEASLRAEYIILFPDNLQIHFPAGTLPSQEHGYIIDIAYSDLQGLIHDWAIPYAGQ